MAYLLQFAVRWGRPRPPGAGFHRAANGFPSGCSVRACGARRARACRSVVAQRAIPRSRASPATGPAARRATPRRDGAAASARRPQGGGGQDRVPAQERARIRPGPERRVGAGERVRAVRAQRQRAHDQPQLARLRASAPRRGGPRRAARAGAPSRPAGGCRDPRARAPAARRPGRCPARPGTVSLSSSWPSAARSPARATAAANGSKSRQERPVLVERAAERLHAVLVAPVGLDPVRACAWPRAAPSPCRPRAARARSARRPPASGR